MASTACSRYNPKVALAEPSLESLAKICILFATDVVGAVPMDIPKTLAALVPQVVVHNPKFPDCDCGVKYTDEEYCKNPLDREFPLPGYLKKQVEDLTSQKLLSTYFRIKTDISQDGMDGQSPNSKPTN